MISKTIRKDEDHMAANVKELLAIVWFLGTYEIPYME